METTIDAILQQLSDNGNMRTVPNDMSDSARIDFTSNDYLGLSTRTDLCDRFLAGHDATNTIFSASASRLLARRQKAFESFEKTLSDSYSGRAALLFNSGYHANTGLISALASTKGYIILADKFVHASIIDGIKLSGAPFERFRHNDYLHLEKLAKKAYTNGLTPIIVAESVYSMEGDRADIDRLSYIKKQYPGALLYVDEAHGVGVEGPSGLGLCMASSSFSDVDIIVGTLGKALCSAGAYAVCNDTIRSFAVNKARSFIFSTALPPINIEWSEYMFRTALEMEDERGRLKALGQQLSTRLHALGHTTESSHIQPVVIGNPKDAVLLSQMLKDAGFDVLPIRTPTVPPGTDRLRLSLSASMSPDDIDNFATALANTLTNFNK